MINRKAFYDKIRPLFGGKLKTAQVVGMEAILDEWERREELTDLRWLAYMLGTVFHETNRTMQPIEEIGKGRGRPYGKKLKHSGAAYKTPDKIYYGRGLVQLTWYENYELMGRLIGRDLLNYPELLLNMEVSVLVMFEGMMKGASSFGDFTGKCLEMYFNKTKEDWKGARRIINGQDKADMIARYGKTFHDALVNT